MKKTIISLFTILCFGLSLFAQNAVQDALKAMPCNNADELAVVQKALAKEAPQSVVELAAMLQPAEKCANSAVEYALSAMSNYGTNPENSKYKKNIKKGFEQAVAAAEDQYNKAFLASQLRLLSPENEKAPVYKSKNDKKISKLWDKPVDLKKALKNKDRKYRVTALQTYNCTANEETFAIVSEIFPKLCDEAKMDVLNWIGNLGEKSMVDLVLSEFDSKNKELAGCAMNAAGKIGTLPLLNALIDELDSKNDQAAYAALLAFNGDIRGTVAENFKKAKGQKALNLMNLASERHVTEAAPKIFRMAEREDGIALNCLVNVVTEKDAKRVAEMMDSDAYAVSTIVALQKAFNSCIFTCISQELKMIFGKVPINEAGYHSLADYSLMIVECVLGLLVINIPTFLGKKFKFTVPAFLYVLYIVFLYCAIFLGEVRSFYYLILIQSSS